MSGVRKTIAVLPGDGIGPEVTHAAVQILGDCAKSFEHKFEFRELAFGGAAIERFGSPLPAETLAGCRSADAILLGAIGGPQWDALALDKRPEAGLLGLRKALGLYINLRPIRLRPALSGISPLRRERIDDCDFEIVRELAGDIYFGEHSLTGEGSGARARDVAEYSAAEIERVARYAFERAAGRNRRVASVDKANVLATSVLWRQTVTRIARDYPEVALEHLYVDNAAMQLLLRPAQFDVILTGNLFGDILSDEAAALAGSIGLIPSLSRGATGNPHCTNRSTARRHRLPAKMWRARWVRFFQQCYCCANRLGWKLKRSGLKRRLIACWITASGPLILRRRAGACCAALNSPSIFARNYMTRWCIRSVTAGECRRGFRG